MRSARTYRRIESAMASCFNFTHSEERLMSNREIIKSEKQEEEKNPQRDNG